MGSLTVRNLDDDVKAGLRMRAASHGLSMEQEVRLILQQAVSERQTDRRTLAERVNKRFSGLEWQPDAIPARQLPRTLPDFNAS